MSTTEPLTVIGIETGLPKILPVALAALLGLIVILTFLLLAGLSYRRLPQLSLQADRLFSTEVGEIYQTVIKPHQLWLSWTILFVIVDLIVLTISASTWLTFLEFSLGLLLAVNITVLGFKLFSQLFDSYLLQIALKDERKINSELLALGEFLTKAVVVLIVVFLFAQTHQINLVGLVASLGIGGVAIAFASQKVIEQILWSVVLYIDQPFTVDDYIHLEDRTLGRVESVGWRSTKIRLSGKNTLMIVPNSNLAQVGIENLTRAERVISMVTLSFFRAMSNGEKALVQQLILGSTDDILGIDHQLTQVTFQDLVDETGQNYIQAQVIFFILGTTENSMELRKGLLEIARENIVKRLQNYGIVFNFEESIVDVTQPMNI